MDNYEIELMKESYSMMYVIENSLRNLIKHEMSLTYGLNWYITAPKLEKLRPYKKSFNNLYYHELLSFLVVYPCLRRKKDVIFHLRQLTPIRNKIAHHTCLTSNEFKTLDSNYKIIITVI